MFLIDKYRPQNIKDTQFVLFYKELIELLQIISNDEAMPHIIFYGDEGTGIEELIELFLEMMFDKTVHKAQDTIYRVVGSTTKVVMEKVKQSNYHIAINPKGNNFDRYLIHDIIKEYAKRRSLNAFATNRAFKVVLINNLDTLSYYAQTSLRRTMERYNDKCRFIMWCRSLSKIIKPLQSRCICIRVPAPTDEQLFKYILRISYNENINLPAKKYGEIISKSNGNVKTALWELEFAKFGYEMDTDYHESLVKIIELILDPDIGNVIRIRNIIFNLMITNYNGTTIVRDILDMICINKNITDNQKQRILQECVEFEYQLVKGRREIIQINAIISSCMSIIHEKENV